MILDHIVEFTSSYIDFMLYKKFIKISSKIKKFTAKFDL